MSMPLKHGFLFSSRTLLITTNQKHSTNTKVDIWTDGIVYRQSNPFCSLVSN